MASSSSGKPRRLVPIGIPDPPPDPSRRGNEPVLDTMVLQAFGFGHPGGIETLLRVLQAQRARFPAEVYNGETLPLTEDDEDLSELALGLRYAVRKIQTRPATETERFQRWIDNASQLKEHLQNETLEIDLLYTEELPERVGLMETYGIGKGEAVCLVLAQRHGPPAVFVSANQEACEVADEIGIPRVTIRDLLEKWVNVFSAPVEDFNAMIEGLHRARFDPGEDFASMLREQLN